MCGCYEGCFYDAWDGGIVRASNVSTNALVARANAWLETQDETAIGEGLYREWAMESFAIARDVAYPQVEKDAPPSLCDLCRKLGS